MKYKNDPRKIIARFGRCAKCNVDVTSKEVFYFPATKKVFCLDCGQTDYNYFLQTKQDEEFFNY